MRESDAKAAETVKIADRVKREAVRNELHAAVEAARATYKAAAAKRVAAFGFDPDAATTDLVPLERIKETVLDVREEVVLE